MNKMLNIERRKEEKQSETSKAKYFLVLLLLLFFVIIINFGRWERPVEVKGAKGVTISYDANGGMGAPKEETKEEGKELKISTTKPVKVGYKFLGWTKVRNAQEIDFKPGSIYKEDVSRTLYASWNANSYKLTFEANGGSTVLPKMVTYDKEYGTLTESKKDGYIFEGWYFDNETFNNVVEITDIVKITSDTTVYAKWEDVEALASLDDPSETPALPSTSTPTTPEATPTQKPTATPTQKPTATPTQEPTAPPTETPVTKVEVSFESNAGINIEAKTVEYGKAYGELPELTYVGYTFEGWYLDNETFTQKVNEISIVETNRDHTLYGGWKYKLAEIEIQATPTEWTNQNVEVTITPKEEIVNGAKIEYRIGNSEWKEYAGKFEVEKNCAIIARTVVGETKGQEASKEITNIDKVAPETAAVEAKEITTEEIELAIKGQDTLSGIKEIRVYVDSTLTKVYVYEENNIELKEEEYKIEGLKQNTEYEIHIEVEDMAGNVRSTQEETIKVTTEKLPAVEISHTPEAWTNQYVDVIIEFANDMSEDITIEWQMEGDTEWFPYEGPFAIGENTTVYARTTDGTDKGETGAHAIENIDKANPTANVIADNDEVTTNSAEIEIIGVDNESGIASIAIYVDGEVEYIKSDYTGNAVGSPARDEQILTYIIEDLAAGTEYEIYTVVTDKAGNIISTENEATTITTKGLPEVSISHAPIIWTNDNVDVTIAFANELASNGTTIEYKIGDGNWQTYTSAFEVTTNSTVYARSAYGDEKGETGAHAIENIDKTNPTANIIVEEDETTTSSAEIEITGVDLESGIASIAIYV
ncbi:MAG: InlB B-repeat-containing protein, partial [Lachnospiraceae bacterium]|nr:InlB B-repeat-containing protein [Lachnospiraceae bacterium]